MGELRSDRPESNPAIGGKPARVAGINKIELAKIGGITPEVLIFSGMWVGSPPNMRLPAWRLGYCTGIRRCARSTNTIALWCDGDEQETRLREGRQRAGARPVPAVRERARQSATMPAHDDQACAVADAARGDLLAHPHQEHGAADQGDDRRTGGRTSPGRSRRPEAARMLSSPTAMP